MRLRKVVYWLWVDIIDNGHSGLFDRLILKNEKILLYHSDQMLTIFLFFFFFVKNLFNSIFSIIKNTALDIK